MTAVTIAKPVSTVPMSTTIFFDDDIWSLSDVIACPIRLRSGM